MPEYWYILVTRNTENGRQLVSQLSDLLNLAEVFEYADTGELFRLQGDTPETAKVVNVAELPQAERSAIEARIADEGVMVFDREDLEAAGIVVE